MATKTQMLEQAHTALTNATIVPEIASALAAYGYGMDRLQEGMVLYDEAKALLQTQSSALFGKLSATKNFQENWKKAQRHYLNDLRAARLALKDHREIHSVLQLNGTRGLRFDEWFEQASSFYGGLQSHHELQPLVAEMGLTVERIEAGIQNLQRLTDTRLHQRVQKGSAGNLLRQRVDAFDSLQRWMTTFRQIARIALAASPQHFTTLGLNSVGQKRKKIEEPMVARSLRAPETELSLAQ